MSRPMPCSARTCFHAGATMREVPDAIWRIFFVALLERERADGSVICDRRR